MPGKIDNKKVEIKFGGDLHEIDVELLVESLVSYSSVTQEVAAYVAPGSNVNIKIRAPKEGSFILQLDLIAQKISSLFTRENITLAAEIVTIVAGLYGLKKWLGINGKPETIKQKGENYIEITSDKGSITIDQRIFNIYQGSINTRENLRKTFARLKEEKEITDFSILDSDKGVEVFYVDSSDFVNMASEADEIEQEKQKLIRENQELSIFKVVFKENYKWEFYYQGNKIYASIDDKEFFDKIEKGEIAFRSGDRLIVNMEIGQVFNEAANTFVNDSYYIIKVVQHIPRPGVEQKNLDFEDRA